MMRSEKQRSTFFSGYLEKYALITVFAVMVLVFFLITPSFLSLNNIINILVQASAMGIATVGAAMVILQGGVDLSAGSCMFFSMIVCSKFFNMNLGLIPLALIAVASGVLLGCLNGILIGYCNVIPFITTLGTMTLARGVGLILAKAKIIIFNDSAAMVLVNAKIFGLPRRGVVGFPVDRR